MNASLHFSVGAETTPHVYTTLSGHTHWATATHRVSPHCSLQSKDTCACGLGGTDSATQAMEAMTMMHTSTT